MKKMTPQEKKRLSLKKDCRNTYGENDKSSRKAIRFRKRWVNRTFRRAVNKLIGIAPSDDIDSTVKGVQRKEWKKCSDTPLGEKMLREGNWAMERRLWEVAKADPEFVDDLARFLAQAEVAEPRLRVMIRRVRAITFDQCSSELDFGSEDLALLDRYLSIYLGEQTLNPCSIRA